MLFRAAILERIQTGEVTLAFRRWRRPTVKTGGRLRTAIGELAIEGVTPCASAAITEADARSAGFASCAELLAELDARPDGDIYRIAFRFDRPDPRIALREAGDLSADEAASLAQRLDRFDRGASQWTRPVLHHIAAHEGQAAADIAKSLGVEKAWLKQNIRKLKELGLTESLETGYRLSPRGRALLDTLPR
jgi:DNA-binding MarR family transcriptional regulator